MSHKFVFPHPKLRPTIIEATCTAARAQGHQITPFYWETYHELDGAFQHACCQRCGARVTLFYDVAGITHLPCIPNPMQARESLAWLTGNSPRLVLKKLTAAAQELPLQLQPYFDPGEFDPGTPCLDSEDGVWRLRWYLRDQPDDPISARNPQYPDGYVELQRRVAAAAMYPATYIGPRSNPNVSDDPQYWLVQPLESGTHGLAYLDAYDNWRFRRTDGVTGYRVLYEHLAFQGEAPPKFRPLTPEELELQNVMVTGDPLDPFVRRVYRKRIQTS